MLYTLCNAGYHDNPMLHEEVDEICQEEESSTTFINEPSTRLNDLVGDVDDIQTPQNRNRNQSRKKIGGLV
jgi:hypothetical protein